METTSRRYYKNKDEILQKRRDKYAHFKDLDKRLKSLEENVSVIRNITKMTQKAIKFFENQNYSKPPKNIFSTNKTNVHHINDSWSLDDLDLKDYGPEKFKGYRYVLVVSDSWLDRSLKKC